MTNKEKSKIKICVRLLKEDGINSKQKVFGILDDLLNSQSLNALIRNQTGLEALERIYGLLKILKSGYHRKQKNGCIVLLEDILDDRIGGIKRDLLVLQQFLTTPTVEELVNQLNEWAKNVYPNADNIKFEYRDTESVLGFYIEDESLFFEYHKSSKTYEQYDLQEHHLIS